MVVPGCKKNAHTPSALALFVERQGKQNVGVFELAIGHPRRISLGAQTSVLEDDGRSAVRPRRNRDYSCALCPLQGRQETHDKLEMPQMPNSRPPSWSINLRR